MKVKEILTALTKYYSVTFMNDDTTYEDQTVVSERHREQEVLHCDFEPDDGDGEKLIIYSYDISYDV